MRSAGISETRCRERLGYASLPRPEGRVVWLHAASVGEGLSLLGLIHALAETAPDLEFLITSGTASSAQVIADRMPPHCRHQFAPFDHAKSLRRFFNYWRPSLAVLVESELWPQTLVQARAADCPIVLLNARFSPISLKRWGRFRKTAQYLLGQLSFIGTQSNQTAEALIALGVDPSIITSGQDLKSAVANRKVDETAIAELRQQVGPRQMWLACSTHSGEEKEVIRAHLSVLESLPDLLLLLVPRHPERGDEIARLLCDTGLSYTRRSVGEAPDPRASVYLADTLNETALWYALTPITFLGGSFVQVGGHNPYEPALAGSAILHGPYVDSTKATYDALNAAGGCSKVDSAEALASTVMHLLATSDELSAMQNAAQDYALEQARTQRRNLMEISDKLVALLPKKDSIP